MSYHLAYLNLGLFEYIRPVILLPIAEEVKGKFDLEYNVKECSHTLFFLPIPHLPKPRPSLRASITLPPIFSAICSQSLCSHLVSKPVLICMEQVLALVKVL